MDFIDTILQGLPFPQIFLAKGDVDVETLATTSSVVDGQQRLNAILGFIGNEFSVNDRYFQDLNPGEKESFIKYEIPVIELDIRHDDPIVIDIFKRLNRTFYSLSNIEKLSTEYASSEFMLVAKLLARDLHKVRPQRDLSFIPSDDEGLDDTAVPESALSPLVPPAFYEWASTKNVGAAHSYLLENERIFSLYEISRKVHLMFMLNVLATIQVGWYARNEMVTELLEELKDEYERKDIHIERINQACNFLNQVAFDKDSYWTNKANTFSLLVLLVNRIEEVKALDPGETKLKLTRFEKDIPSDYRNAAREAVNNKRERITRNKYLQEVVFGS